MNFKPKPHVSVALRRLRLSVLGCSAVLASCLVLQMLVWAFVGFTDARWTTLEASAEQSSAVIISDAETAATTPASTTSLTGQAAPATPRDATNPTDINRVLSRNDRWFSLIAGLAQTAGIIAAIILVILMLQAVVLASGASVPGVEMAVTATTWALAISLICLPLADLLPSIPFRGVFSSYVHITESVELRNAGAPGAPSTALYFAEFLLLPSIALLGVVVVAIRFTMGIEQGSIVTNMSELEEKLDREMSSVKLVSGSAPRTVGALHRAIGDSDADDIAPSLKRSQKDEANESARRIGEPTPGSPMSRPI